MHARLDGDDLAEHLVNDHGLTEPDPDANWRRLHARQHDWPMVDGVFDLDDNAIQGTEERE